MTHKTRKEVQQIKADLAARDAESIGGWDQMGGVFWNPQGRPCPKRIGFCWQIYRKSIGNKWTSVFFRCLHTRFLQQAVFQVDKGTSWVTAVEVFIADACLMLEFDGVGYGLNWIRKLEMSVSKEGTPNLMVSHLRGKKTVQTQN